MGRACGGQTDDGWGSGMTPAVIQRMGGGGSAAQPHQWLSAVPTWGLLLSCLSLVQAGVGCGHIVLKWRWRHLPSLMEKKAIFRQEFSRDHTACSHSSLTVQTQPLCFLLVPLSTPPHPGSRLLSPKLKRFLPAPGLSEGPF